MAHQLVQRGDCLLVRPKSMSARRAVAGLVALTAIGLAVALALVYTGNGTAISSTATPADQSLLDSVVGGMSTDLTSVTIGATPASFSGSTDTKWLYVIHKGNQSPAQDAQDAWYASLIAGAYEARCGGAGTDCLAGYSFQSSAGPQQDDSEGAIGSSSAVPLSTSSQAAIADTIKNRLSDEGLGPPSVSFEKPYGLAPVVEIRTDNPQAAVSAFNAGDVFAGLDVDGAFMRMTDTSGNVFFAAGFSTRAQEGRAWVQPGLAVPNTPQPS
jgi:hypothetical protein